MKSCSLPMVIFISLIFVAFPTQSAELSSCDEASLRAAMANGGEIIFACDGTIILNSTIQVGADTTLRGNGRNVTISGAGAVQFFLVLPGVSFSIDGLVIADGFLRGPAGVAGQAGGPADGGAILNLGILSANNCNFVRNRVVGGTGGEGPPPGLVPGVGGVGRGGAICNGGGQVFITGCVFADNQSSGGRGGTPGDRATGGAGRGGALYSLGGTVSLSSCLFSNNAGTFATTEVQPGQISGGGEGGAIFSEGALTAALDCQFITNRAAGGDGGASGGGGGGRGGVLRTLGGTLTLTNCLLQMNLARGGHGGTGTGPSPVTFGASAEGGAMYCAAGTVMLVQCQALNNEAIPGFTRRFGVNYSTPGGYGGALVNVGATVRFIDCKLAGNTSISSLAGTAWGGAAYQNGGGLSFEQCDLSMNRAVGGLGGPLAGTHRGSTGHAAGGAIHLLSGSLFATNSIFASNASSGGPQPFLESRGGNGSGGALANYGNGVLENCTLAGNQARGGEALASFSRSGDGLGGAIYNEGNLLVNFTTIAHNLAEPGQGSNGLAQGAGIYSGVGSTHLRAAILADNQGSNCFGAAFIDQGHNLSSDASCPFTESTSASSIDPVLGPLGDYGGSTQTIPLLQGSPALDAVTTGFIPPRDQRGRMRPFGPGGDIGAFESSAPYTIRGTVTGFRVPSGIEVSNGSHITTTAADLSYRFDGLAGGSYVIAPSQLEHLMVPATRTVSVGPDALGIDLKAYRWNSLLIEKAATVTARLTYAGTNGNVVRFQASTQLPGWNDFSTNTVGADGLIELDYPASGGPRLFRALIP